MNNIVKDEALIHIPAGDFLYGYYKERKHLPAYWISQRPVTNRAYALFVTAVNHPSPRHWQQGVPDETILDHPVVHIEWHDAQAYAAWCGLRLPSEQEWEKAARGQDGRLYPWGNKQPTPKLCNFGMHVETTTAVGTYSPQGDSPYGCWDMSGNVWEWTGSWYDSNQRYRVVRGGGYRYRAVDVRAAYRFSLFPDFEYNDVGFRLAKDAEANAHQKEFINDVI